MAWTYDESDLTTTTASGRLNVVRLLIGDTDTNDQLIKNEAVSYTTLTLPTKRIGQISVSDITLKQKNKHKQTQQ